MKISDILTHLNPSLRMFGAQMPFLIVRFNELDHRDVE